MFSRVLETKAVVKYFSGVSIIYYILMNWANGIRSVKVKQARTNILMYYLCRSLPRTLRNRDCNAGMPWEAAMRALS